VQEKPATQNAIIRRTSDVHAITTTVESKFDHFLVPRAGLQLPRRLSFEKWVSIGQQLSAVSSSSAWCLGDWLVYGQETYTGRYRDAIEQTSLDYQTLRNYAWIVRRFTWSRRREALSFGHHAEVAALSEPEQDFWLRKAEELGWSRNQLRHQVRTSLRERSGTGCASESDDSADGEVLSEEPSIQVKLTPEQLVLCQEAAAREGLSIEAWAANAVTRVARDIYATMVMQSSA